MPREPRPFKAEVDFILRESARYLRLPPQSADIKSVWVGLRPLVKPPREEAGNTQRLSREHTVLASRSGLVTVTGGKWTTYRAMAEDVLAHCFSQSLLGERPSGQTAHLRLVGAPVPGLALTPISQAPGIHLYGAEQARVLSLPGAGHVLCPGLTEAMVRFAARYEYALKVEDVLARRSRLLFLDARLAGALADQVGEILQQETGQNPQIEEFMCLAQDYLQLPG